MFFIPDLISPAERQQLTALMQQIQFVDGRSTAAGASYQKNNLQAGGPAEAVQQAQRMVQAALDRHPKFRVLTMPRRVRPVTFNRYDEGMFYRDHTDHALLPANPVVRGDLSMTLFLSEPASYDGGELVINSDREDKVEVKLPAGHAVVYSAATMHRVNTVTRGSRVGAVTVIESLINNAAERELLGEMAQLVRWVQDNAPQSAEERRASKIYANLMRMWCRP
ncbi:MAG: Fe2+-dependent dioxygenase [Xanthomonadales bacterium]|jgi:PKHD-type hydroxylase|nr:Fe2+-dependent dioxygenase [Xanthomonadales bacterium]